MVVLLFVCSKKKAPSISQLITDFEWYIGVLVRMAHVPGNDQGAVLSEQLMDVAVRVDVVRRYAVKEMLLLLQDSYFYSSQSGIVDVLFAAAWIAGEFSERKESQAIVEALLLPWVRTSMHSSTEEYLWIAHRSRTAPVDMRSGRSFIQSEVELIKREVKQLHSQAHQRSLAHFNGLTEMLLR